MLGIDAGMVAVAAAGDAAHVDLSVAGPVGGPGHGGQELDVILEAAHLEVRESLGIQHHDRERHVLQVLGALGRGDDDLVEHGFGGLCCAGFATVAATAVPASASKTAWFSGLRFSCVICSPSLHFVDPRSSDAAAAEPSEL